MRPGYLILLALSLCLFSACKSSGEKAKPLAGFWQDQPLLSEDFRASEDRFADFAERCAAAPEEEALAALDTLFDRLKAEDEVAYYIYAGWMEGAFYNPLSPCRSEALFAAAVGRIERDGILSEDECRPFQQKRRWMSLNRVGEQAVLPDGVLEDAGRRTLVLVLDLSCPSCREALTVLAADERFADYHRLAVCCGHGPLPEVPGWDYRAPGRYTDVFDIRMTPFYFLLDADGRVTAPYTPAL